MSMNRSICDSRCSGFPVELEHSHIAIARGLMHISLSIAPRPSPDHMRSLSFDFHLKFTVSLGRTGNGSKEGVLR